MHWSNDTRVPALYLCFTKPDGNIAFVEVETYGVTPGLSFQHEIESSSTQGLLREGDRSLPERQRPKWEPALNPQPPEDTLMAAQCRGLSHVRM